ncbi:SPFH domain-containing protein [Synechococcus sp. CBW1002]|uniref:SPFH domain-containing protein n=1 Tax=Synechococcus sp. CBW1002 TaxID=1353134 RepID=UPI0018CE9897|nr:SPFH domain-containing protein [Synechococcus sp. CBW1002]QPN60454.1 SPFH domain-containing protein [Synechococcus sp. CBW1002]
MAIWEKVRSEFIDVIEWPEQGESEGPDADAGATLVWRFPRQGNAIKMGAQLTVRPGQWAVFVNEGRIADGFGPGRYVLETRNLPFLTSLLSLPYGFESPFKAEVVFVATRQFTNLKWGTRHPVLVRDRELGPVRLRGFGTYALQVRDPAQLMREVTGSQPHFNIEGISEQLRNLIVTRLADLLGESEHPVLDLAANYDELAGELGQRLAQEVEGYGLAFTSLLIENLSLPPEVEAALDRRNQIALSGDLQAFTTYQAGIAMEKAAANPGGEAAAGVGMGIGLAMAQRLAGTAAASGPPAAAPGAGAWPGAGTPARHYHLLAGQQQLGPYTAEQLLVLRDQGQLTAASLLWHPGLETWQRAADLPELAVLLQAPPPPPPIPPAVPEP